MDIWVLGTLEVSHDGRAIDIRGPQSRRLLALLSVTPGIEVSADRHGMLLAASVDTGNIYSVPNGAFG